MSSRKDSIRLGFFLARRSILRGNRYVTVLIVAILMLIFLNLLAVGGLLIGMLKNGNRAFYTYFSGTVEVKPPIEKQYIQYPDELISFFKSLPGYLSYSARLNSAAKLEVGYKEKKIGSEVSNVSSPIVGIDPDMESKTTSLQNTIIEGRFLRPDDRDKIVLGAIIAGRGGTIAIGESLKNVNVGDKVLATYGNGVKREYTVVGIMLAKPVFRNLQSFVNIKELDDVMDITSPQYTDIAIKTVNPLDADHFRSYFVNAGYTQYNLIQTWEESLGSAINDINTVLTALGDIIGAIGVVVGSITIFILIFVNAISHRKYIGILKAIGIKSESIILSYVLQGFFYTVLGIIFGSIILFGFLIPYFNAHPIDLPFADTSIYVSQPYATDRIIILLIVSIVSGLIPARLITNENTLDAILGR